MSENRHKYSLEGEDGLEKEEEETEELGLAEDKEADPEENPEGEEEKMTL